MEASVLSADVRGMHWRCSLLRDAAREMEKHVSIRRRTDAQDAYWRAHDLMTEIAALDGDVMDHGYAMERAHG